MDSDNLRYAPLSALQHFIYCKRQCALIHLERVWVYNRLTAEGNVLHEKVHQEMGEGRPGVRISRGLPVVCESLGLLGQCDVVEFYGQRNKGLPRWQSVKPVEYKRGRPKSHEADRVQLCAQALCLEEMLGMPVIEGALFYGEPRRRTLVEFTTELRTTTKDAAKELHTLLDSGSTPPATYQAKLCRGCSLIDICLPRRREVPSRASVWFKENLNQLMVAE